MEAKAFEESALPPDVKALFAAALKNIPDSRLLLIRRKSVAGASGVTFFAAFAREQRPVLYEYHFETYEELLSLDLLQIFSGLKGMEANWRQQPLFLVCTNGRRDPCCARWGPPVLDALSRSALSSTWQCSHLGGHRFAANVLYLPDGIYYGRVDPAEVESLVAAHQDRQLYLPRYREHRLRTRGAGRGVLLEKPDRSLIWMDITWPSPVRSRPAGGRSISQRKRMAKPTISRWSESCPSTRSTRLQIKRRRQVQFRLGGYGRIMIR
jgi:(2Fe-2S) ferredoxin